jgi:hypothetical protein
LLWNSAADPGCFIPDPGSGSDDCSIPDPDPGSATLLWNVKQEKMVFLSMKSSSFLGKNLYPLGRIWYKRVENLKRGTIFICQICCRNNRYRAYNIPVLLYNFAFLFTYNIPVQCSIADNLTTSSTVLVRYGSLFIFTPVNDIFYFHTGTGIRYL